MKARSLFLAVCLALPVSMARAEPTPSTDPPVVEATSLTEDELRQAITGKTIYLNVSGFDLPIRYKANGRMTGSMGTVAATFSKGDGSRDSGRWWIESNQLCQRWTSWLDAKTHCYRIIRRGETVYWSRDDGVSGTVRLAD